MKTADACASGLLAALAAATCVGARRLGLGDVHNPGPGFMPFATAAALGLMAAGALATSLAGARPAGAPAFAGSRWGAVLLVLGVLAGFGATLERAGFSVTAFVMLVVLFGAVARKRWWVAVGAAALVVTVARLVVVAVGLPLPEGWFGF